MIKLLVKCPHCGMKQGFISYAVRYREQLGNRRKTCNVCDNDRFCQAVIKKRFPGIPVWGDIQELIEMGRTDTNPKAQGCDSVGQMGEAGKGVPEGRENTEGHQKRKGGNDRASFFGEFIDLLTGGFPCQPFSQAGNRRGKDDSRFLWPAMLECIRLFKPAWVIAENVRGILSIEGGLVFQQVCLDLEAEGYEVWPFIIPELRKLLKETRYRWRLGDDPSIKQEERRENAK